MKSWADHCSSDEEDSIHDDTHLAEDAAEKLQVHDEQDAAVPVSSDEVVVPNEPPPPRTYDFPSQPPFTAFVGNLSYNIKDVPQFVEAVSNLAKERLEEPVNVLGGRIAYHRTDPGKHRGFGYVEVETLDQLKALMTLNDGQSKIAGRNIQLDTANHQNNNRRGSHQNNRGSFQRGDRGSFSKDNAGGGGGFGDVDGSKFRGGKYNSSNRGGDDNNKRRGRNRNSFNNNNGGDNNQSDPAKQQESSGPPAQRPSLKLAPRSKPVDTDRSSTSSNIFGGATARDEQVWQERRTSMQKEQDTTDKQPDAAAKTEDVDKAESGAATGAKEKRPSQQDRRQSGRGRGGRGRGSRGGGRGDNDKGDHQNKRGSRRNSQQDKKQQKQQSSEEKAAAAMAAAAVPDAAPKKTEASNKFALLMDSDSE